MEKYSKITKKAEKDLDKILEFIVNDLDINILINFRSRLYPEYRSLLNTIAFRKHKVSPSSMAQYYRDRGLHYAHDQYLYSLGKFDLYCTSYPELKNYLNLFFKESTPKEKKIVVIDKSDLTEVQKLVSYLTQQQSDELIEMITLRKKSWAWKMKNEYEIIESC